MCNTMVSVTAVEDNPSLHVSTRHVSPFVAGLWLLCLAGYARVLILTSREGLWIRSYRHSSLSVAAGSEIATAGCVAAALAYLLTRGSGGFRRSRMVCLMCLAISVVLLGAWLVGGGGAHVTCSIRRIA
jgi:hypothetical protein